MSPRLRFDGFELRPDSGELLQEGSPVKLQPQPLKVLEILARRSGEVVTREEIRRFVWGDSFVDFDASLNFCVKEIRRALVDSATAPRFIETLPRRGYRFLRPVQEETWTGRPVLPARSAGGHQERTLARPPLHSALGGPARAPNCGGRGSAATGEALLRGL
ncbi:MAG TPA: transcriptional regulator [Thermoanaerobaculia bacterium]|nr:transcriptional regulator [Thermoanaerobaculia bacterium]